MILNWYIIRVRSVCCTTRCYGFYSIHFILYKRVYCQFQCIFPTHNPLSTMHCSMHNQYEHATDHQSIHMVNPCLSGAATNSQKALIFNYNYIQCTWRRWYTYTSTYLCNDMHKLFNIYIQFIIFFIHFPQMKIIV